MGASLSLDPSPSFGGFPIPKEVGIIFMVLGAFILVYSFFFRKSPFEEKEIDPASENAVMCPECRKPAYEIDFPGRMCPKCNIEVENVDGFYDRHPELRPDSSSDQDKPNIA